VAPVGSRRPRPWAGGRPRPRRRSESEAVARVGHEPDPEILPLHLPRCTPGLPWPRPALSFSPFLACPGGGGAGSTTLWGRASAGGTAEASKDVMTTPTLVPVTTRCGCRGWGIMQYTCMRHAPKAPSGVHVRVWSPGPPTSLHSSYLSPGEPAPLGPADPSGVGCTAWHGASGGVSASLASSVQRRYVPAWHGVSGGVCASLAPRLQLSSRLRFGEWGARGSRGRRVACCPRCRPGPCRLGDRDERNGNTTQLQQVELWGRGARKRRVTVTTELPQHCPSDSPVLPERATSSMVCCHEPQSQSPARASDNSPSTPCTSHTLRGF